MQSYVIALYIRLSIEDYKYDSLSIENQSLVLHEYAAAMPEALHADILEFIDNGYSGTNFERPQVQKLIEMVRSNQIDCIIVKDFSRFGRNSIETGYFIERVFPLFHTRFISVSDDFDSDRHKGDTGGMEVAFKYLINEYYSRDMSIKTKSAKYAKMQRGEYQSKICPYGYRKSADGRMEPDPEAAEVVRLIFQLSADGVNAAEITRELYRRGIPTPGEYKAAHGNHTHDISRTHGIWNSSTVLRMLEDERYIGTYVIGKRAVLEVGGTTMVKAAVSQRPEFDRQIEALEDGKLHLYEQFQLREIDLDTYKTQKEALDAQLLKVKNAYVALSARAKQEQEAKEKQAQRKSITKKLTDATGLTTELAGLLINKVYVFPDKRIEIAYRVNSISK